ncbi:S1/P1 nuclease [Naviculisporaceae sp. PSN 640]
MLFSKIAGLLALTAPGVNAWGDFGHRTVAYLAEKHFTPKAAAIYGEILENDLGYDISDAATWADTIKRKMPWSKPLHYINPEGDSPPQNCTVFWPSDCPSDSGCIVSAIQNYTEILLDTSNPAVARKNATMFLLHLIGDLHQPLHATGFERGGNDVKPVCWNPRDPDQCPKDLNLHSVWDSRILHKLRGLPLSLDNPKEKTAAKEWANELFKRFDQERNGSGPSAVTRVMEECADLSAGVECILEWTRESNALVCSHVIARGVDWILKEDLAKEYFEENKEVAEEQIAKAGLRLAAWLNAIAEEVAEGEGEELVVALESEKVLAGDL